MGKRIIVKGADFSKNGIYGETPEPIKKLEFFRAVPNIMQRGEDLFKKTILIMKATDDFGLCVCDVSEAAGKVVAVENDYSKESSFTYALYKDDSEEDDNIRLKNAASWNVNGQGWTTVYAGYKGIYPVKPSFIGDYSVPASQPVNITIPTDAKWLVVNISQSLAGEDGVPTIELAK